VKGITLTPKQFRSIAKLVDELNPITRPVSISQPDGEGAVRVYMGHLWYKISKDGDWVRRGK